jgi:predicted 3-demethylubiquinone-9 3-methyltransferase (glyoxalase superfamily)
VALETSQKITPFLWFNDNADEAVDYYLGIFPNAKKTDGLKWPDGRTLTISFELEGLSFTALNGGPHFKFNESVSFFVRCKDQAEIDYYWNKLTADGGQESDCGWLKDKFGLSWQIVPEDIFPPR